MFRSMVDKVIGIPGLTIFILLVIALTEVTDVAPAQTGMHRRFVTKK
jgi:hypothetical protein